jgi:hypothetical protein
MRRIHFEQTMITRKVTIVRQTEMSVRVATNQKSVVLSERKDAAFVWAGGNFQVDLHGGD